ncbi:MAG: hypothetical protein JWO55_331 [Candidatus Saccharibacteria bacterium]|jgi:hypothetical protein|nr:hypothetical protein [Candidatus Saccharibacteria bacterium]
MEAYESEYAAPAHTITERRLIGRQVITAVVLDGEYVEFVKDIGSESVVDN